MATLLLVDDDRNFLRALRLVFELDGYRVLTAHDGADAWALATAERPGAIVTDLMMPGIDGLELCRRLKAEWSTLRIPIVMLTATFPLPARGDRPWDVLLSKPVSAALLRRVVDSLTGGNAGDKTAAPEAHTHGRESASAPKRDLMER
ncbi:response regulator [Paraburkholderia kururiensis]|uniref:Response regulator n=1 Tax=Paraburkholderia kururiensis TaxID=984307 RepID=A0ABZ0WPF8_9BURK|nr:response regulator [Paraburkholderia kururiensis]WQD79272.1 response regulator [Paraburkholderia kururiensis]